MPSKLFRLLPTLWVAGVALLPATPASAEAPQVSPPSVLEHTDPVYPPSSASSQKHADVMLVLTIDADGHVTKCDVLESAGPAFDEAAIAAARRWLFKPATRNGVPVAVRIKAPFHFAPPEPAPDLVETKRPDDELPVHSSTQGQPGPLAATAAAPPATATTLAADAGAAVDGGTDETDVTVRGRLEARSHGTSDYQVTVGELKAVPRANAADALKLAPGFLLTNEGGSGHAEQVFLRGFDAHEGQDLEFTVDGVPINDTGNYHGNGYADTHFIIPELIRSVRVLEGPYAPQQGNFAVAGSADYQLGLDTRGLTAQFDTGNFNTQRLLVTYGPSFGAGGTFAGAEFYTTDGFGSNRQAKRGTAIAQYEFAAGHNGLFRVTAQAYATEYNGAGVVRLDDYQSGRVGFYGTEDPNQTGNTASRASLAATYEAHFENMDLLQQLFVVSRTMRLRENWTGFLHDIQAPNQTPHGQRGDMIDFHFDEVSAGARGFARWHGNALGLRQEFEAGYFARVDQTHSTQNRVYAGSGNGQPYVIDGDYSSTLGDVGVYIDGNVHFLPWLGARGGVRADMFLFDVLNGCAATSADNSSLVASEVNQSCLTTIEQGSYREPFQRNATAGARILPRGSLVVGPFRHFEGTFSLGDGIRSVDPSNVAQGLATPFITVQSRDLGFGYVNEFAHGISLTAKSVFFETHVDQDLIFNPTEGRNTLASGSTRTGWAGSVRAIGSFFDLAANATVVRAVFDDTHLLVPYIPDLVLRADGAAFSDLPWHLDNKSIRATVGYGVSYVGRRPLPYGQVSDITFVSDASAGAKWGMWSVRLSAQNLFDAKYKLGEYNYASNFNSAPAPTLAPERSFTAGAPRTFLLSLSATLGGS